MNDNGDKVLRDLVASAGGVGAFRLVDCPDGTILIQQRNSRGGFSDIIIEDDQAATATIKFLTVAGVERVDWART